MNCIRQKVYFIRQNSKMTCRNPEFTKRDAHFDSLDYQFIYSNPTLNCSECLKISGPIDLDLFYSFTEIAFDTYVVF